MRGRRAIWPRGILAAALAVGCLSLGARVARADVITFDVSGSLSPGYGVSCQAAGCSLSGTLVVNNTTGTIYSADIMVAGESPLVGPFYAKSLHF